MSNIPNLQPVWHDNINQVEKNEYASGGVDGNINLAPKQLAENVLWLKLQIEALQQGGGVVAPDPSPDTTPDTTTPDYSNGITSENFQEIFGEILITTSQRVLTSGDTPTIYITSERNAERLAGLPLGVIVRMQSQGDEGSTLETVSKIHTNTVTGNFNSAGVYSKKLSALFEAGADPEYIHRMDIDGHIHVSGETSFSQAFHKTFFLDFDYGAVIIPQNAVE